MHECATRASSFYRSRVNMRVTICAHMRVYFLFMFMSVRVVVRVVVRVRARKKQ